MTKLKTVDIKGKRVMSDEHKELRKSGIARFWENRRRGTVGKNGYRAMTVMNKRTYEHIIVWEKHNGEIPKGFHIHHKNGDKLDNRIDNLEMMSASEHTRLHAIKNKLGHDSPSKETRKKLSDFNKKCSDEDIIKLHKKGYPQWKIGEAVGLSQPSISIRLKNIYSQS